MELNELRVKSNKLNTFFHRIREAFEEMSTNELESNTLSWNRGFDPGASKEHSEMIYEGEESPIQNSIIHLIRSTTL
jgi:hypothetical protein